VRVVGLDRVDQVLTLIVLESPYILSSEPPESLATMAEKRDGRDLVIRPVEGALAMFLEFGFEMMGYGKAFLNSEVTVSESQMQAHTPSLGLFVTLVVLWVFTYRPPARALQPGVKRRPWTRLQGAPKIPLLTVLVFSILATALVISDSIQKIDAYVYYKSFLGGPVIWTFVNIRRPAYMAAAIIPTLISYTTDAFLVRSLSLLLVRGSNTPLGLSLCYNL
jgi:hypothetical protein